MKNILCTILSKLQLERSQPLALVTSDFSMFGDAAGYDPQVEAGLANEGFGFFLFENTKNA